MKNVRLTLAPVLAGGLLLSFFCCPSSRAAERKPVTKDTDRGIRIYFWAQDNRHILYLRDTGGDENWRLFAVDLDTRRSGFVPVGEIAELLSRPELFTPSGVRALEIWLAGRQ